MRIAILGASGHVATNLIWGLTGHHTVIPFSRKNKGYDDFYEGTYDVIINCVGFGNPTDVENAGYGLFRVTEQYDEMCLRYLRIVPETKYIYISSGAVYGNLDVNNMTPQSCYQLSKLYTEAKHRSLQDYNNIIDIRLFSFFSRFANLDDTFFMTQLVKAVRDGSTFVTDNQPMMRDYIHPKDLTMLVEKIITRQTPMNRTFDAYSLRRIEKQAILNYFKSEYNLKVEIVKHYKGFSTANRSDFYSIDYDGEDIHYVPRYESIDTIKEESGAILHGET